MIFKGKLCARSVVRDSRPIPRIVHHHHPSSLLIPDDRLESVMPTENRNTRVRSELDDSLPGRDALHRPAKFCIVSEYSEGEKKKKKKETDTRTPVSPHVNVKRARRTRLTLVSAKKAVLWLLHRLLYIRIIGNATDRSVTNPCEMIRRAFSLVIDQDQ